MGMRMGIGIGIGINISIIVLVLLVLETDLALRSELGFKEGFFFFCISGSCRVTF